MSLFSELRRRNVFRVGVAYIVAAWLIIQVAETIFPLFGFGDTPARIAVILLAIGFPLFLVFSWVFEITPEGLMLEKDVRREESIKVKTGKKLDRIIIVLLALGLGYFSVDKFVLEPRREALERQRQTKELAAAVQEARREAAEQVILDRFSDKSVAVLPFITRGADPEDQFFADGMHDEVLTRLSKVGALKVIAESSVMTFRDTDQSLAEIARALSVATILEGAVTRAGSQVRVNVKLIDPVTREHLWAETFDHEYRLENLFAMQTAIATAIAEVLEAPLSDLERQRLSSAPTESFEAYNNYLRGRRLMASRQTEKLWQALEAFERAVQLDPGFVQAWVGIAESAGLLGDTGALGHWEALEKMQWAAGEALSLDDKSGEAYASLAWVHRLNGEPDEAEAAFERAIELSPNYAMAYMRYANTLSGASTYRKSLDLYYKAAELDPRSSVVQLNLAGTLWLLGREDEALERHYELLQMDPGFAPALRNIAEIHALNGRLVEAIQWLCKAERADPLSKSIPTDKAYIYLAVDDYVTAAELRRQIDERPGEEKFRGMTVDFMLVLKQHGWQAGLRWLDELPPDMARFPAANRTRQLMYLLGRDFRKARDLWLEREPGWAEPELWEQLIEQNDGGCFQAGIFISAGERDMGEALLQESLEYLEYELPRLVDHMDRYRQLGYCYLLNGSWDEALDFFEQNVAHGHWTDHEWAWIPLLPWWDPVRDDPRFINLIDRVEELKAAQRVLLQQLDATAPAINGSGSVNPQPSATQFIPR